MSSKASLWRVGIWGFGLLALASVVSAVWALVSARGDRSWPVTNGHVLQSHYAGTFSPVPPSRAAAGSGSAPLVRWQVAYEYSVDGATYRAEDVTMQPAQASGTVRVYYDVDDASNSVLEPGVDGFRVGYSLAFAAFFLLARLFSVWGLRSAS